MDEYSARWRELMSRPESDIPLDEAALLIAGTADPGVDVGAELTRLDDLAAQIGPSTTENVCQFVFGTLGLRGNDQVYDDPKNSYLPLVLDRRLGIPISLSVVLIEIGRRCGVRLEGVGMPGHFLVRDPDDTDLLIDAFSGGRRLSYDDCARLLHDMAGPRIELEPRLLAPVGTRAIAIRMLANLEVSFKRRDDAAGLRWVTLLRVAVPGQSSADRLAAAETLAGLGCRDEAVELLEGLALEPGTTMVTANALKRRARGLRAPFN